MAEKEYEKQIAAAKAALEGYSAQQNEIARLYEQAKQNAATEYDRQKSKLASDADKKTNQAAVDMLRTERNIDQTLASRGLAFSGENAQTRLDLTLALRDQLNGIESDQREAEAALERERASTLTDLDLTFAKEKQSAAEKEASLRAQLASGIAAREAAAAQQGNAAGNQTADKKGSETEKREENKTDAQKALEKFLAGGEPSRRDDPVRYAIWSHQRRQLEEKVAKEEEEANAMIPEVSARELAKQFVQAAGSGGKVYGYEQQSRLAEMLGELQKTYQLTGEYEQQLLLNLRSLGYSPDYVQRMNDQTQQLRERASELYLQSYERYVRIYALAGMGADERAALAEKAARFEQLAYMYANSESSEWFEAAVAAMGLSPELSDFYSQVTQKNREEGKTKYRIGSNLP